MGLGKRRRVGRAFFLLLRPVAPGCAVCHNVRCVASSRAVQLAVEQAVTAIAALLIFLVVALGCIGLHGGTRRARATAKRGSWDSTEKMCASISPGALRSCAHGRAARPETDLK